MLSSDEFGLSVTFKPAIGSPVVMDAIYEHDAQRVVERGDEAYIQSQGNVLWINEDSLPSTIVPYNDHFIVNGTEYIITNTEPDGTGMVVVYLSKDL